jgi:hypothetical protein
MRSRSRFEARFFRTMIACALLAACGSSTDSPTDPPDDDPDGPGTTLTPAQRFAALEAVNVRIDALTGADANSRRAELLSWLDTRSEFEDAGTNEDGSLWARFQDGRLLLIIANRADFDAPAAGPATHAPVTGPPARAVGRFESRAPAVRPVRQRKLRLPRPPSCPRRRRPACLEEERPRVVSS